MPLMSKTTFIPSLAQPISMRDGLSRSVTLATL